MRALFIANPQATTTTTRARDVILRAMASEFSLDVRQTQYREHAKELARQAAEEGYELVISLGGDGTVNEVVNGILTTPSHLPQPAYAALPGGSANVFIRALGLPSDPVEATGAVLEALRTGARRTVGLGRVSGPDDDGRYFTFCAGFGWDAEVVREVERRRHHGHRASPGMYMSVALNLFYKGDRVRDPSLTVHLPDRDPVRGLHAMLVTNTTPWTYAGAFPVQPTPRSRFHLGLDAFALTHVDTLTTARLVGQMLSPRGVPEQGLGHLSWHDQPRFVVECEHPRAFQIDGEYLGERKQIDFCSIPKALRVVY
ncbi:diacylglycerol/lipid kinase family protein [Salinactinospora qingdaonensis]|uniref:Diacylglycerol kinase family protein n=1 Tax=Salinactinospora qingdaonensis TaxID=702744 RepID=A0ABP7G8B0_9ACTN